MNYVVVFEVKLVYLQIVSLVFNITQIVVQINSFLVAICSLNGNRSIIQFRCFSQFSAKPKKNESSTSTTDVFIIVPDNNFQ